MPKTMCAASAVVFSANAGQVGKPTRDDLRFA
jgi:hypothetical protein